jgi:hypothetical protein
MPEFFFTRPRFTARRVDRVIGQRLGRRLTFQESNDLEDLDGAVDITSRVHVQVGADYLVVCAWQSAGVMRSWPPRRNTLRALRDLHEALEQYPETGFRRRMVRRFPS